MFPCSLRHQPKALIILDREQVEDQLFKVHQYHLAQESEHFRQLFKLPATPGSDERPLPLPGVTVEEFEALLDYFYRP